MLTRARFLVVRPEVGVFVLAALVRLVPLFFLSGPRTPLTYEYEWIADRILAGNGFLFPHLGLDYLSMRPVFVYLCVAVYWLTGHSHLAMLVVQALVSGGTAVVVFRLARQLGTPLAALAAAGLTAIEPALVYYDITRIHPLGLHTLLLAVVVLLFVRVARAPRAAGLLLAGVAVGFGFLERGTPVVFAALALVLISYWHRYTGVQAVRAVLIVGLGSAIVVAPWAIRNYRVYGRPVLAMTAGPELLWIGSNPNATGTTMTESGQTMFAAAPADFRADVLSADESTQQRLFSEQFRRFVFENPGRSAALFLKKLRMFWWFGPQEGREHAAWALSLYRPVYAVWLGAALWGFVRGLRGPHSRAYILLLAFLGAVSVTQSLAFVEGRHRLAVVPILLVASAYGLMDMAARLGYRAAAVSPEPHV